LAAEPNQALNISEAGIQIITTNRNLTELRISWLVLEVDSALKIYSPQRSRFKRDRND